MTAPTVFVDTSIWYAAADAGDRSNARAKAILSREAQRATTDHVLVECWLLIRHRLGARAASRWWAGIRSGVALIEPVGPADLEVAWAIAERYSDQDFSIVDCTSFAVMQRLGLRRAASFDGDFAVFRFGRRSTEAFEVVR